MNLTPLCGGSFECAFHINQRRVEGGAPAEMGEPCRGEDVDVDAAGKLGPSELSADDAGRDSSVDTRSEKNLAALVEYAYAVAVPDAAGFGVRPAHFKLVLRLHFLHAGQIHKSAVEEVIGLARQQFERKLPGADSVTRLFGRNEVGHGIHSVRNERAIVEPGFAVRRRKPLRKR